ncbi:MAG: hypothetical protein PHH08_00940 [Candidatus ainarchaeum sp.]|nr:hypothetical protein [Candidatus ainarchaeum sp.]
MPVFGKGRKHGRIVLGKRRGNREPKQLLGKQVARSLSGFRAFVPRQKWNIEHTSFGSIKEFYFTPLFGENGFISRRYMEKKRPLVVLDWGCGAGDAISGLASEYRRKVRAYGFAKDIHENWAKIKNVKLIGQTKEGLLRMLKDNSVDLIYSTLGLGYLFREMGEEVTIEEGTDYVAKLFEKVAPGGKLVFECDPDLVGSIKDSICASLKGKAVVVRKGIDQIDITKN